ncbi:MAG: class I SAM-dependent methyltransferase [Planctomycetota bacterium]|jgi:hypothetical protein
MGSNVVAARKKNRTNLGAEINEDAMLIWQVYLDIFQRRWGISPRISEYISQTVGSLSEAEFIEYGPSAYSTSIALPIRNAAYQAFVVEWRWRQLREMGIMSPVLDYGCGVGILSLWLHRKGYKDLYGYELPGIQQSVMAEAFKKNGIHVWDGKRGGFNTVICLNVLEHVEHPVELLNRLYGLGKRVIADICIDADDKIQRMHVAPHDELRECRAILCERRGLYEYRGPRKVTETIDYGLRSAI